MKIIFITVLATLSFVGSAQGSDEGNSTNNGELEIVTNRPIGAPLTKKQKEKLDGAASKLVEATSGIDSLLGGASQLPRFGPSSSARARQAHEQWQQALTSVVDRVRELLKQFRGISESLEADYEMDYRQVRASSQRLNGLVISCASLADKTLAYIDVLPDSEANRQRIEQTVVQMEVIANQMAEIKGVLDVVAELPRTRSPKKKASGGNG